MMEEKGKIFFLLLAFCGISLAFDLFTEDNSIPSDGFHDLLGLTPFWMTNHMQNNLRRTLGTKRDNLPSTLDDFLSPNSGTRTYEMAGSCNLKGTFTSDKATLEVEESDGCAKPSLTSIFKKLFPTIDVFDATEEFILPDQFEMKKLEVVKSTNEVTVEATAKDTLAFAEREILVSGGTLTLGFTSGVQITGMKDWRIKIEGIVGISTNSIKMVLDKAKEETSLPFTWEIKMVSMVDLMGIFGITSSALNFDDIGFDSTKLEGITFTDATIKGQLDLDDTFQIVAKASVAISKALQQGEVWLILTRPAGATTKAAVIIDVKETDNIKDTLEVFITQKESISDFGMIGKIERDCIIMCAKEDIIMIHNEDLMSLVSKFITEYDTKQIPKGVHVRALVPMKDNMKTKCSEDANFSEDVPDILPITIKINLGGISFSYPDKFKSDLPSMLKCLDPQKSAKLPSQLFPKPDGLINIKEFDFTDGKKLSLTIVLKGPFEFLGGIIKLADLELSVSKETGENWKFEGATTITVGQLSVGVKLAKDGGAYTFSASVASFKLNQLEEMIGPSTITTAVSLLGSLSDFGIKDFKLVKEFGEKSSLRVSGVPILWGWDKASIEGLVWKPDKKGQPETAVAVGLVIESVRLDKLLEKILGNNLFSAAWFSEMTAICIVSNADAKVESEEETSEPEAEPDEASGDDSEAESPKEDGDDDSEAESPKEGGSSKARGRSATIQKHRRAQQQARIPVPAQQKRKSKRDSIIRVLKRSVEQQFRSQFRPRYAPYARTPGSKSQARVASPKTERNNNVKPHQQTQILRRHAARHPTAHRRGKKITYLSEASKRGGDDDEAIKFNIPYLTKQKVRQGLTFIAIFNIPKDDGCHGDSLCLWLAEKVGRNATIEIMGAIGNGGFKFSAKFAGEIPLVQDKLTLQEIELSLELSGKDSNVKLSCTLNWHDKYILGEDEIQFQGAIEVGITGKLSLEFDMIGMWTQPFGFEYLAFGNLHLAIGISIGVPVPSFEFGAEIWVGNIKKGTSNNDHAIKIAGYFGINVNNPADNYVYASVNAFTLRKVFEAFELGAPDMPDFLADTGFPEGITVAYSTAGKEIEAHDISIEAGLYLKGTLSFLGYNVSAEINVNPGDSFKVDIQMSPIDWANGLIAVRRSEKDKANGPKAFIHVTSDSITVQIEGYISLLGMSGEVKINVSDSYYEFRMETKLWNILHSKLYVKAAYGSLSSLSFEFEASISINLHLEQMFNAIKDVLKKAADAAKACIEAAQRRLDDAKRSLENANRKMDGWKNSINEYQDKLRRRSEEIERQKNSMAEDCRAKCGKVCVPFLDWEPHCFKLWWWWIGCPTWNHCRWKVDNIICIAGCEIKKLANKFAAWAEQVGLKIMIGLAEIGKGLIDVGKGFVGLADKLLDFAKGVLEIAKKAVAVGARIAEKVTDWLGKNLFHIRLLKISGKLDSDFNACVGLEIDCTILGITVDYKGSICINLNFWKNLASDTVEQEYPGVKKQEAEVQKVKGDFEEFDKDKTDLSKEEQKIESDVKHETTERRKRDYVPTAEEDYYRRLAEEPLPTVITRSAGTVNAFKNDAPWVLVRDFDARNFDHTPHVDVNIPAEKRTLDEDWEKHAATPCVQIHKVIDKYSVIADGISAMTDSLRDIRGSYQATKRTMQQGVDSLEDQVKDTESKHNITYEESGDLHHWYKEAKDGFEKWDTKARGLVDEQHEISMPSFRSQINHILMNEKKTDFHSYMDELHKVGQAAYKRSNIPNEGIIAATQELHGIKRDLVSLVANEDLNPLILMRRVKSVRSNIQGLRRSMERCH